MKRHSIELKTGRVVEARAPGMSTMKEVFGNLPIIQSAPRSEEADGPFADPLPATGGGDDAASNLAVMIRLVCLCSCKPRFTEDFEKADASTGTFKNDKDQVEAELQHVDELTVAEGMELSSRLLEIAGLQEAADRLRPMPATARAS